MESGMTPTPEIHLVDKPFIAQQFSFSNFQGNPRGKCPEQIKTDETDAPKMRRWLLEPFSQA
jgi:hypothetical protein